MNNNILETFADLLYILSKSDNVEMNDLVRNLKCLISGEVLEDSEPSHFAPKGGANSKRAEFLTSEEVAARIGCASKTVRNLIEAGYLKVLPGMVPYKITRQSWNEYKQGKPLRKDPDTLNPNVGSMPDDVKRLPREKSLSVRSQTGALKSDVDKEKEAQIAVENLKKSER